MKKNILLIMGLFTLGIIQAQVGINTNTPQAMLDVVSSGNSSTTKALSIKKADNTEVFTLQNNGNIGLGVINPTIAIDLRDGTDNSIIGIGQSQLTASAARAGTIKYTPANKSLFYSDGSNWIEMVSAHDKTYVNCTTPSTGVIYPTGMEFSISEWNEESDLTNSFDPTTSIFTSPFPGIYSFSVYIVTYALTINAGSFIQVTLDPIDGGDAVRAQNIYHASGWKEMNVGCSGSFHLAAGERLQIRVIQTSGSTVTLNPNYNYLSISES